MAVARPPGGRLPTSAEWLARLYAGDRVPREKKPLVFDHLRSAGPWMVSVDAEPQSVLDGMSQTATVCGGFAEDPVVAALVEGRFADTLVADADTAVAETPAWAEFASTLRQLVPGLPHVTFVASGAEANEKALALCHLHCARPGARKVLAFDGSFHGRTLLAIHATHSPSKRAPFELAGYEATFAPFPVWDTPGDEPDAPSGYYAAAASGDLAELLERFGDGKEDPLLASELRALAAVDGALATGEYFVCTVEPMQSEGGDRYATERFFRALRLLTRRHATFLCFDEVQVGFGLGGAFAWHSKFRLLNSRGQPDYPDAVVFAKRAQVGVVMSRFDDPEPGSAHNASLVRGRLHADMMSTSHAASRIDKLVRPRLDAVARAYPHLVGHPRGCGYAFAFDLPTPALLDAFIGQRFWRGAVVFAAGTRTARYRLSESFGVREIDFLFETIRRSLSWLDAHPGKKPPEWEDLGGPAAVPDPDKAGIRFRSVPHTEAMDLLPAILDIEYQVYEPARRTPPAEIRAALAHPEGSVVVAETGAADKPQLVGFAIGAPLEESADVEGPDDDPMLGTHNTMYSVSITVAPGFQNSGVGRRLKELQLQGAMAQQRPGGGARYRYVTGRNRVGRTAQMTHLNRVFGAHVVQVLTGQYEDPEGQAIYYRIPLGPITPEPSLRAHHAARHAGHGDHVDERPPLVHDLASGLTRPLAQPPASLQAAESGGLLYGARRQQDHPDELRHAGDGARHGVDQRARARPAAHVPDLVARRDRRQGAAPHQVQPQGGAPGHRPGRRLPRPHGGVDPVAVGSRGAPRRQAVLRLAAGAAPGRGRGRRQHRRHPRRRRRRRRTEQGARPGVRAGRRAHRLRPARGLPDPAGGRAGRARPAAHLRRAHHRRLPRRRRAAARAVRLPVDRAAPRRPGLVGRRPDRLPAHPRRAGSSARR
jgi:RHH-type proline utilization regulon transcriptional repressor/proline dehydrogenase/delta 1-pyrroline-5-carboxylate dehydrogenase